MRDVFLGAHVVLPWVLAATSAVAADAPPPAVVADFSRHVQPLLFNRCANGNCHGGADAGGLQLIRHDFTGRITRDITLGNLAMILAACGPEGSPASLIETISGRHPKSATSPRDRTEPLSPRERAVLERWLTSALDAHPEDHASRTPTRPLNRFQKLLDESANPPQLPPPPEPGGVILKERE